MQLFGVIPFAFWLTIALNLSTEVKNILVAVDAICAGFALAGLKIWSVEDALLVAVLVVLASDKVRVRDKVREHVSRDCQVLTHHLKILLLQLRHRSGAYVNIFHVAKLDGLRHLIVYHQLEDQEAGDAGQHK